MVRLSRVRNLRMEYLENLQEIDSQIQHGFEIHIEYDYLLNVDIDWILKELRYSIISAFNIKPRRQKDFLTFRIRQVSTEHSILITIFIGVISGVISGVTTHYLTKLMDKGYEEFKRRAEGGKVNLGSKPNIRQITLDPIIYENGVVRKDKTKTQIRINQVRGLN